MKQTRTEKYLVDNLRSAQKMLRVAIADMVSMGMIVPHSDEARFFIVVNDVIYDLVDLAVKNQYVQVDAWGNEEKGAPLGAPKGEFLRWLVDQLNT